MFKSKYIKAGAALSLVALVIGVTVTRLDVNNPVKRGLGSTLLSTATKVSGSSESDLDENTSRVYFSIFRFISNLVPASN